MGLAAREIEAWGDATVSLSIVREITEKTPPPRALFLRWPFGHALGEAGAREQQLAVLERAFRLLFEAPGPGTIRDTGLKWRRETYLEPDWEGLSTLVPPPEPEGGS